MPRSFAPHKLGAHRRACLSLYRALLRECASVGAATESSRVTETLQCMIRYRFQKDKEIISPSQASNGIQAGHGFLNLLRDCSDKSATALDQLSRTLESVRNQAEDTATMRAKLASFWKPPHPSRFKHLENLRRVKSKANHVSTPENPRIFQPPRPLSEIKYGVRKVPNFMLTHGIPLLKYPGPTPVLMNRVLKNKILWGTRKFQQHGEMQEILELAEREDEWDVILEREHGIGDHNDDDGPSKPRRESSTSRERDSWAGTIRRVDRQLERDVHARGHKYAEMGRKLWQVVLAERAQKEKEATDESHKPPSVPRDTKELKRKAKRGQGIGLKRRSGL